AVRRRDDEAGLHDRRGGRGPRRIPGEAGTGLVRLPLVLLTGLTPSNGRPAHTKLIPSLTCWNLLPDCSLLFAAQPKLPGSSQPMPHPVPAQLVGLGDSRVRYGRATAARGASRN